MSDDRTNNSKDDQEGKSPSPNAKGKDSRSDKGNEGKRVRGIKPRPQRQNNYTTQPSRVVSNPESVQTDSPLSRDVHSSYGADVLALVDAVVGKQPNSMFTRILCTMTASSLFDYLSDAMYRHIELRTMRPVPLISEIELRYTFRYILLCRIAQVWGVQMPSRPAEIRYPAILGPILASIGKYLHPVAAYELTPSFDPEDATWYYSNQANNLKFALVTDIRRNEAGKILGWRITKPEFVDRVLSVLVALGSHENLGLPVDTILDTDEMFRLENNELGQLTGSGDFSPSGGVLLARAFVELAVLNELYGQHRVVYAATANLRSAVDKLAGDSFTTEVGGLHSKR